jgi:hypothetical protein
LCHFGSGNPKAPSREPAMSVGGVYAVLSGGASLKETHVALAA